MACFDSLSCRIFRITGADIALIIHVHGFNSAARAAVITALPPVVACAVILTNKDRKESAAPLKSPVSSRAKPLNACRSVTTDKRPLDASFASSFRACAYPFAAVLALRSSILCVAMLSARFLTSAAAALTDSGAASRSGMAVLIRLWCSSSLFPAAMYLALFIGVERVHATFRALRSCISYCISNSISFSFSLIAPLANSFCSS